MTSGHTAVMAQKRPALKEPAPCQALEFFPTPPWATRALMSHVLDPLPDPGVMSCWEPCAGLGHMADVLRETFDTVRASDVYCYPVESGGDSGRFEIDAFDFLDEQAIVRAPEVDWIITNPPFSKASAMLSHALVKARIGVAFLLRMQWLEGETRFREVYAERAPSLVAPFVERVPMCEGGVDLEGSTATMYAWFVWLREPDAWRRSDAAEWLFGSPDELTLHLIPPCRAALTRPEDRLLARRCVPGWIAPSKLKRSGRDQGEMFALRQTRDEAGLT